MPSRFARQFGYAQLYVGNPNTQLAFNGNLCEGARAWYYSVAGGTEATFRLPVEEPKSLTSFTFCTWYSRVNQSPDFTPGYTGIEGINAYLKTRSESGKRSHMVTQYLKVQKELERASQREAEGGSREELRVTRSRTKLGPQEGSSSSPYSRSDIKDSRCPLGAGDRDGDEMKGCRTSCCHPSSRTPLPLALVS